MDTPGLLGTVVEDLDVAGREVDVNRVRYAMLYHNESDSVSHSKRPFSTSLLTSHTSTHELQRTFFLDTVETELAISCEELLLMFSISASDRFSAFASAFERGHRKQRIGDASGAVVTKFLHLLDFLAVLTSVLLKPSGELLPPLELESLSMTIAMPRRIMAHVGTGLSCALETAFDVTKVLFVESAILLLEAFLNASKTEESDVLVETLDR